MIYKRVCDCGNAIETTIESQVKCNQCLIHPFRKSPIMDIKLEEKLVEKKKQIFKARTCPICKKEFSPTGAAQRLCPACKGQPIPAAVSPQIPITPANDDELILSSAKLCRKFSKSHENSFELILDGIKISIWRI